MSESKMSKGDRDALIRIVKSRAKRAERDLTARRAFITAEVLDLAAAEYDARDKLWQSATAIAEEAVAKANAQIAAECIDLGIPAKHAPRLQLAWQSRSAEFMSTGRRNELVKLAEKWAAALHAEAKAQLWARADDVEESLIVGGLESDAARGLVESLPSPESLLPALTLDDLGVKRWQPPEDIAGQLTTPTTTAGRRRRQVLRAIEAHPTASDRAIAKIAGVDHKTVAATRPRWGTPHARRGNPRRARRRGRRVVKSTIIRRFRTSQHGRRLACAECPLCNAPHWTPVVAVAECPRRRGAAYRLIEQDRPKTKHKHHHPPAQSGHPNVRNNTRNLKTAKKIHNRRRRTA